MVYGCEEILIEILARLPAKSLVRFMGVCRLWKSIITGPQFRLESSTTKLLVHTDQECLALEDENHLAVSGTTDFPFKHWLRKAIVVGSDNGLVCIGIQNPSRKFPCINVIWNPSIRKHAVIPMNPLGEPDTIFTDGFGATISGSDYKYVRIVGFIASSDEDEYSTRKAVDVYSWKAGTWRRIYLDYDKYRCVSFWPKCVSLRGRLHWTGSDIDPMSLHHANAIYAFDLEDEVFEGDIMLPECFSSNTELIASVFVVKGSQLAMIANEKEPNCSVWVMQEYGDVDSWTKLFRLDLTSMINVDRALHEFGGVHEADISMLPNSMVHLMKNGELLLGLEMIFGLKMVDDDRVFREESIHRIPNALVQKLKNGERLLESEMMALAGLDLFPPKLVKYNPKTSKATDVVVGGVADTSSELRGFTSCYKESLVFLAAHDDHRVHADHEVLSGPGPAKRRKLKQQQL